jgi:hypothetical protein
MSAAEASAEGVGEARCSWCGAAIDADDGYRVYEPAGARWAAFCRLEHIVPWNIQGAHWDAGELAEPQGTERGSLRCSECGADLGEVHVLCIRHRGEHRVSDAFCSVDHLAAWATAGGRWR